MFEIKSICKGGGYRYCRTVPIHPKANSRGLYPLHRVLMENKIGRLLMSHEHVHHKDENKTNDNIENLEILTASEHCREHRPTTYIHLVCSSCKESFVIPKSKYTWRKKRSKGNLYCSTTCVPKYVSK